MNLISGTESSVYINKFSQQFSASTFPFIFICIYQSTRRPCIHIFQIEVYIQSDQEKHIFLIISVQAGGRALVKLSISNAKKLL